MFIIRMQIARDWCSCCICRSMSDMFERIEVRKSLGSPLCRPHHRIPLRQSACLPLNSIVIHRTDRPKEESTIQEIKWRRRKEREEGREGEGNRCSKTVCPPSALLLFQITPQTVHTMGRAIAREVIRIERVLGQHGYVFDNTHLQIQFFFNHLHSSRLLSPD